MRTGLILNGGSAPRDVELARQAETAGFDGVYAVEFFNRNALVRLAAIATATEHITIGSAIANTFTRSPIVLGTAALDVDELSGGRLVLGLGTGLKRMNEEWYGVPFSKPASRTRELIVLLRQLFATQAGFSFSGDFYDLAIPAYSRPSLPRTSMPIWLAAVNRGMIATAGAVADGIVGHPIHSRRWHREVTLPAIAEAESGAQRAPGSCPLYPYVIIAVNADREVAVRDAKRQIGFSFTVEHYHSVLDFHGLPEVGPACRQHLASFNLEAMADAVPDELVDEIAIACTPDEVKDRLAQWEELTPEALLYPAAIGTPGGAHRRHARGPVRRPGQLIEHSSAAVRPGLARRRLSRSPRRHACRRRSPPAPLRAPASNCRAPCRRCRRSPSGAARQRRCRS